MVRIIQGDNMETLVIGTGNEVYGDDSIGIHILRKLQRLALPKQITLLSIGDRKSVV